MQTRPRKAPEQSLMTAQGKKGEEGGRWRGNSAKILQKGFGLFKAGQSSDIAGIPKPETPDITNH